MADILTMQDLANGHLDVKALGEAANGDENTIVTTRTGNTYPSAERAISIMFQNGGLPATPFSTRADKLAAALPVGSYAVVTNDSNTDYNKLWYRDSSGWIVSKYDAYTNIKTYVDANPLFKPQMLPENSDADTLLNGIFVIWNQSVFDTMLHLPPIVEAVKMGTIFSYNNGGIAYQQYVNYRSLEKWERAGNGGGSSSFAWNEWVKVVKGEDVENLSSELTTSISQRPKVNLFTDPNLVGDVASIFEAVTKTEDGYVLLEMDTSKISLVSYDIPVDGKYLKSGAEIVFYADIFSDQTGSLSGDISIQAYNDATLLTTSSIPRAVKTNEWHTINVSMTIPAETTSLKLRFIRRTGNTVVKYRQPLLTSNSAYYSSIYPLASTSGNVSNRTVYVSKNGSNSNDSNNGKMTTPYLTIQKAIDAIPDGGNVVVLDSAEYRESVTITSSAHVKISAVSGGRVNLFGSDKLAVTKTSGMTKVYQAPLAEKPTGMGNGRGEPVIFEWGTPSKPIPENERHFLHRGLTHRLPYTEMFEAATKAELDSVNGKWFWESGIVYFTATDGGDARLKRYEARARPVLMHSNGTIELVRVSSWFSSYYGMDFNGLAVKRTSCMAYGAYHNGFADNANFTESYRDIAGGNGNDAFNLTVSPSTLGRDESVNRIEGVYFDPYGHDNGDDGISCHYRSDCTIYGGLFEHNTKADVVHVTGSNSVCYGTESRGTTNGFYTATNPDLDTVRVKTVMRCVGTKSTNNGYSYRAADNAELHLDDCVAITPSIMGYNQSGDGGVIRANNCKFDGDALKAKSGNVVVKNTDLLTP